MDVAEFEVIGGHRFCIYRPVKLRGHKPKLWQFPLVLIVSVGSFLAASKWAVVEVEKGNFLPANIVAIGLMAVFGLTYALAVVLELDRKRKPTTVPDVPPRGRDQIACHVSILHAGKLFLSTEGWIGLSGDLLTFHGESFDFALRQRDFHRSLNFDKLASGKPSRILTLRGLSPTSIKLRVLEEKSSRATRQTREPIEELIGRWRRAPISDSKSMFPPLKPSLKPISPTTRRKAVAAVTALSGMFALVGLTVHWMFREYLPHSNPVGFALVMAMFPLVFVIAVVGSRLEAKAWRKVIEKAKQSGRVELV
jgi:hypothetical protein